MPFTAAHPAIVIPLKRYKSTWFSSTGLIIGSIAPDFGYFISFLFAQERISSHTFQDIIPFNLPVTIVLAILFHGLVRDNLIVHLPPFLKIRGERAVEAPWFKKLRRDWYKFLISAVIGIISHIIWDSFTHHNSYMVNRLPLLLETINILGINIPLSRIIQHLSTVIGLAFIAYYTLTLPKTAVLKPKNWIGYWLLVLSVGLATVILNMPNVVLIITIDELVVRFISGCLLAVLVLGSISKLRKLIS